MSGYYSQTQEEIVTTGDYKRVPVEPEYRHLIKEQDEKILRLHPDWSQELRDRHADQGFLQIRNFFIRLAHEFRENNPWKHTLEP
jgi:hypothetical protein